MNLKPFFADALGSALEIGIGTPEDVLKYVTPDVLAQYLPRPLWARLLTACLGAPQVDAQLVLETIGVPNLCEHVPGAMIWACIAEIAARALGQPVVPTRAETAPILLTTPKESRPALAPPPEPRPIPAKPTEPVRPTPPSGIKPIPPVDAALADLVNELNAEPDPAPARARTPTGQRFRQSSTGIGRLGANQARRPQAAAAVSAPARAPSARRNATEVNEIDPETELGTFAGREIAVDDSQLVDWQSTENTNTTTDDDFGDLGRKR